MLGSDSRRQEVDLTDLNLEDLSYPFEFDLFKGNGSQGQLIQMKDLFYEDELIDESAALATFKEQVISNPLTVRIISQDSRKCASQFPV